MLTGMNERNRLEAVVKTISDVFKVYPSGDHWDIYVGSKAACQAIVSAFEFSGINCFKCQPYENSDRASIKIHKDSVIEATTLIIQKNTVDVKAAIDAATAVGTRFGGGGEGTSPVPAPAKKRGD
jgi:hypothetical protein